MCFLMYPFGMGAVGGGGGGRWVEGEEEEGGGWAEVAVK